MLQEYQLCASHSAFFIKYEVKTKEKPEHKVLNTNTALRDSHSPFKCAALDSQLLAHHRMRHTPSKHR